MDHLVRSNFRIVFALLGHLPLFLHNPLQILQEIPGRSHSASGRVEFTQPHRKRHRKRRRKRSSRVLLHGRFQRVAPRQCRRKRRFAQRIQLCGCVGGWTVYQPLVKCNPAVLLAGTFVRSSASAFRWQHRCCSVTSAAYAAAGQTAKKIALN